MFRYSTSIYGGGDVLIGASWDLLPWFVAAGAAFIVVHAVVKAVAAGAAFIVVHAVVKAVASRRADAPR